MDKTQKEINKFLSDLEKNPSKIKDILETTYLKNLSPELRKKYFEYKKILLKFKKELENIAKRKLIGKVIEEVLQSKQDKFLTSEQRIIKDHTLLAREKHLFVIDMLKIFQYTNLNKIKWALQEYVVSNLYRTYCETSIRLFTDMLLIIIDYNLTKENKNKKYINNQKKIRERVLSGSITLENLRKILDDFDSNLQEKIGLSDLLKYIFLYKEGRGFSLRNDIAHERLPLSEIDVKHILKEIHKVNLLDQLLLEIFYLNYVNLQPILKDLNELKKTFRNKKS